jgi:hypothetical protein
MRRYYSSHPKYILDNNQSGRLENNLILIRLFW